MIRLTLFFLVLSLAAVSDIRKRMIPDWMPLLIAGVSLLPPEPVYLTGLLVALPLLIAGITVGGIGGGDIKDPCRTSYGTESSVTVSCSKAVHKENKKTKLCSREGTGISACSFPACRDGYKCLYVFVKWHF